MEYQRKPEDFGILDAPRERARHEQAGAQRQEADAEAAAPALGRRAPTVEEVLASNAFGHCVDDDLGGPPEQRERREAELEEAQQEGVAADFEVDGAGQTAEQVPHPDEEEDADADDGDDYFFPAAADALPIDEPPPDRGEHGGDGADDAGDAGAAGAGGDAGDAAAGGGAGGGDGAGDDDAPPSAEAPPPPPVTKKSSSRKRK